MLGRTRNWAGALAALGVVAACGHTDSNPGQGSAGSSSAGVGDVSQGATVSGGTSAVAGTAQAGTESGGTATVPSGGASSAGSENVTDGGHAEAAGAGGAAPEDILAVKPSPGCGKSPMQSTGSFVKYTLPTSGTKPAGCADSKCGAWSYEREYYLSLPANYQISKAYPLVLEAPGCGGDGSKVLELSGEANQVIRVGLTPPPNEIGHSTNPGQGCFDDKEGDDSVDFVFYEKLIDKLKSELCYDENRVFVAGQSSGAWLANELGCKYAGNTAGYAIRGVAAVDGYLSTQVAFTPTCSDKPMAGIWVSEVGEPGDAFVPWQIAISRAMKLNGCSAADYPSAEHEDYNVGGGNPYSACQKILGCSDEYPLVVCNVTKAVQWNITLLADPAFATFVKSLEAP